MGNYKNSFDVLYNAESLNVSYTNSSYDRTGANVDYDTWLYEENGGKVIMDVKGSGCITRMFFPTSGRADSWLKIYIDNELIVNDTLNNIFTGKNEKFEEKLVYITNPNNNGVVEQSGYTSYVQIPFFNSVKILSNCPSLYYYHINYTLYDSRYGELFTSKEYKKIIENIGVYDVCGFENKSKFVVNANSEYTFAECYKSGKINCVKLTIQGIFESKFIELDGSKEKPYMATCITDYGYELLNKLYIKAEFDSEGECIYSPLSAFFGLSLHGIDQKAPDYLTKSVFAGVDGNFDLYFNFPMPFKYKAKLSIVNTGNNTSPEITAKINKSECLHNNEILYLKSSFITVDYKEDNLCDMELLKLFGKGALVGAVMSMDTDGSLDKNKQYLEGDEHIYIDGSLTPQHNGTGTEDFFNGAYYWASGTYSGPFSGCMFNTRWGKYSKGDESTCFKSSAYRYMLNDRVSFNESLVFNMEHGSWSDANTSREFGSILFIYYINEKSGVLKKSAFHSDGESCVTSQYEGYAYGEKAELNIKRLYKNEIAEFKVYVPNNTSKIILRRVCDYSILNQNAEVLINGKSVGEWYTAGKNETMSFHSSEFVVYNNSFLGESNINITFNALSNEFNYAELEMLFIE